MTVKKVRPVVLLFTAFYLPGFRGGGPIQTIANLVDRLGSQFDFRIVTSDRDLGDCQPYPGIKRDVWTSHGNVQIFYASPKSLSFFKLPRIVAEIKYDILYLNSLFAFKFSLVPIFFSLIGFFPRHNILLAPRGELGAGALGIKPLRKRIFLSIAKKTGLFKKLYWQASTESESADIRRAISTDSSQPRVFVARDLMSSSIGSSTNLGQSSRLNFFPLRVCFLSRISRMKNLDFALEILSKVTVPVEFDVYGPKEDAEYWSCCAEIIARLPQNVSVRYLGEVNHDDVCEVLKGYDILFVPSKGENFGHVFIEAFSAGVPVLLSDRTPWRGLREKNIGWDISLDRTEEFIDAIDSFCKLSDENRGLMRKACVRYAKELLGRDENVQLNIDMFNSILIEVKCF